MVSVPFQPRRKPSATDLPRVSWCSYTYAGVSRLAEQNSRILDFRVGLRLGSLRTWIVVSSACIRSCDSSSAFMREWTFDSHLTCTFMTQLAMSCLDISARMDLSSASMRYSGRPREYLPLMT